MSMHSVLGNVELLKNVFCQVALPPSLPEVGNDKIPNVDYDQKLPHIEENLVARLLTACDRIPPSFFGEAFGKIKGASQESLKLNNLAGSNKVSLSQSFEDFPTDKLLILHVRAQNAALLIRRDVK